MGDPRTENVVGALALALADAIQRDAQARAPEGGSAAAAIALIGHAPGLSIERLRRALNLSHPGAVRLVDRLVQDGMVIRTATDRDRRAVALRLTGEGEATGQAILAARGLGLSAALDQLSPDEATLFGRLAEKLLRALIRHEDDAYRTCRLCDYRACVQCPVDAELRVKVAGASGAGAS